MIRAHKIRLNPTPEQEIYFRKATGTKKARIGYALTRLFIAKNDNGRWTFNSAELTGNAVAMVIGNAYYPHERGVRDNFERLYMQYGTDGLSQVLKEFWPDIRRKLFHKQ